MDVRNFYHGTSGDTILRIIRERLVRPNSDSKIFFSERSFESVLMHGADVKRKETYAIKVRVTIPEGVTLQRSATPGVADTIVAVTSSPLPAEVLELYIRPPRGAAVRIIQGEGPILMALNAS